jgi:Phage integrase, N-terminal SAM-like domain
MVESESPRLLTQVRARVRFHHYGLSTKKAYLHWIRFFIRLHGMRHRETMGGIEVEAFLMDLASECNVRDDALLARIEAMTV